MSTLSPRILFCSLSAKTALYQEVLSNALLFSKDAKVIACDSDPACPSRSKVDHFIQLPRLDELSDELLLEICRQNQITHILPTRDSELYFWAIRKDWLKENNIITWVSDQSFIKNCDDKLAFYSHWKDSEVAAIPTFEDPREHSAHMWVAKERIGSGSRSMEINISTEDAINLASRKTNNLIFQPFICGREFTAEAWISKSNACHGPLLRWRNSVVKGESHHSTIFTNSNWESMMRSVFLHRPGARGHCIAQVIVSEEETLHLVEINPRLGGASPLALRGGLNSIAWHFMEESERINKIPPHSFFKTGMSLVKKNGVVAYDS